MIQENTALKERERGIQEVEVEAEEILTRITNLADSQDQDQGKGLKALTSNKKVSTINQ